MSEEVQIELPQPLALIVEDLSSLYGFAPMEHSKIDPKYYELQGKTDGILWYVDLKEGLNCTLKFDHMGSNRIKSDYRPVEVPERPFVGGWIRFGFGGRYKKNASTRHSKNSSLIHAPSPSRCRCCFDRARSSSQDVDTMG